MNKLKTKEQLLADFKKANKKRRVVLANRAGFDTPEDYKNHLISQISNNPSIETKLEPKITVHNVHLLDCSVSMIWDNPSKFDSAKLGIKAEISELQKETDVNFIQTLVTFSSGGRYKVEYSEKPIKEAGFPNYVYHGNTALYDAINILLYDLITNHNSNDKVVLKIFTDGEDNDSRFKAIDKTKTLISKARDLGITITFVGTKRDTSCIIRTLGIDESNTLIHNNTSESVLKSFNTTTMATKRYATRAVAGEDTLVGFYKQSGTL